MLFLLALQLIAQFNASQTYTGTIATAGTSQVAVPASEDRRYLMCQNPAGQTGTLFVDIGRAAQTTGSIELAPGGSVTWERSIPTQAINVTSATAGARYNCKVGTNQ